jgi:HD-like signal output (HDOD) protein
MVVTNELATRLDQFVAQASDLYSLPRVAAEVLELTRDAAVDTARLKQCIEKDPALVAKLLRVVNSSLFGLCREVSDLNQALALLGIKPLKLLVLGFCLPEGLFRNVAADFLAQYWRRTLTTAIAAREICTLLKQPAGDEAFIAGLLKHLGMLVLVQQAGGPYVQFVERMQAHGMDLLAAEKLALGFDHLQLTSRLLEQWRLPAAIVELVGDDGDEPPLAASGTLRQVLESADAMAVWLVDPRIDTLPSLQRSLRALGPLQDGRFGELLVSLHEKVRQLAGVLCLELPAQQTAEQLTLEAYRELSAAGREAAEEMLEHRTSTMPLEKLCSPHELQQLRRLVDNSATRPTAREQIHSTAQRAAAMPMHSHAPVATTGDPSLLDELVAAVALCRRTRKPLALALVELDQLEGASASADVARWTPGLQSLRQACQQLEHDALQCLDAGENRLALILVDCERQDATRLVRQLPGCSRITGAPCAASASVGIAAMGQIPRNFPAEELLTAAERCLSGAQASGGNCIKSMDL